MTTNSPPWTGKSWFQHSTRWEQSERSTLFCQERCQHWHPWLWCWIRERIITRPCTIAPRSLPMARETFWRKSELSWITYLASVSGIHGWQSVSFMGTGWCHFIGLLEGPESRVMMLGDIGMIALSPCHIHCMHAQSCLALCDPMDCNPPGSSVHGILQARILEWVAMPSSRGSSQPKDRIHISSVTCIGRQVLHQGATWEVLPCPVLSGKPSDTFTEDSTKKLKTTWVTGFVLFCFVFPWGIWGLDRQNAEIKEKSV